MIPSDFCETSVEDAIIEVGFSATENKLYLVVSQNLVEEAKKLSAICSVVLKIIVWEELVNDTWFMCFGKLAQGSFNQEEIVV